MSNGGTEVSWTKVAGASGYVIYRNGSAAKTVKSSVSTWKDTKAYDSQTGMYWVYNYYVKAFKTVNGNQPQTQLNKEVDKESFKGTERIDPGRLEQALINGDVGSRAYQRQDKQCQRYEIFNAAVS